MNKTFALTGAAFGLLAVLIGAFGAHGLSELLDQATQQSFETGVKYQMYHALLLLILGLQSKLDLQFSKILYVLITVGVVLFSFSIYGLATNSLTAFDFKTIAFITPIGGALLIAGWAYLGYLIIRKLS